MTSIEDTMAPARNPDPWIATSAPDEAGRWLFVPPGAERVVVDALLAEHALRPISPARDPDAVTGARLTARESDVLTLTIAGLSNKEIARRLNLSPSTVRCHMHNLLTKANLLPRGQLSAWRAALRRPAAVDTRVHSGQTS